MDKHILQQGFKGYRTKTDETTVNPLYMVSGSKNVLINTEGDKIISRAGYSVFTDESEDDDFVLTEKVWASNTGVEFLFRFCVDGKLQVYAEPLGASFLDLLTTLNGSHPTRFDTVWNATELLDELLFVNHSSTLYSWTGGHGTVAAVAVGTITINETIAEQRFLLAGTRSIMIRDSGGVWRSTAYTAQAGSVFTVSTDLSAFTFDTNAILVQVPRENANTPVSGFTNDVLATVNNQVHIGSHSSRVLYISSFDDYTDYAFSTPRIPGEGVKLTLDDTTTGLVVGQNAEQKESMVVFSGRDRAYYTKTELQAGSTADRETVSVVPIPGIGPRQGARSQELIAKAKNSIIFINHDNELTELGSVENFSTIQNLPISDAIKPDFLPLTFTRGMVKFSKNNIFVTDPGTSALYVFDMENRFWQPPQTIPVGVLSYFGGDLYGHSNSLRETYLLFNGLSDRAVADQEGGTFQAVIRFGYNNHGERDKLKNFTKYYTELYMTRNLEMEHTIRYEYGGARAIRGPFTYAATEADFLFVPSIQASLGSNSLGVPPLGRALDSDIEFVKYRRIKPIPAEDYFEYQCQYEADILDSQFQLIAHGPSVKESSNNPVKITQ